MKIYRMRIFLRSINEVSNMLLSRFREKGVAQVKGYTSPFSRYSFGYIRESGLEGYAQEG